MWPTVAVKEVEDRWRPMDAAEKVVAVRRIKDAETELQYQLRERGVTGPSMDLLWRDMYVRTVADMVRRIVRNPEGWSEERESIDDYDVTRRRGDGALTEDAIYATEREIAKLLPFGTRRRGAFSIVLGSS